MEALVIGLDGATWTVLEPLMASGVMPALAGLVQRGARAPLHSVMPPLTPPGWTSLVTGKLPGAHGVFDFFRKESPDSEFFRLTTGADIDGDTIWTLASGGAKRVLALNFPVMFPPPAVRGRIVPGGWMPWKQLRLGCHPSGLFDELRALPSFDPRELALDMELEAKAVEGCADEEYVQWVELHIRRERRWYEVARHLLLREDAELVGIVFDGVDKLQHLCWRFLDPACRPAEPAPWETTVMELCEEYFRCLDEILAGLLELAGPDARVIVASDHGFGPTSDLFYVNSWLEQEGFLAWADTDMPRQPAAPQVGFAQMTRHISLLDWSRTLAYAATPSSQGIHIVTREPGTDRPLPSETYDRVRNDLAAALRRARNPRNGRSLTSRVWTREEAFAGPHEGLAPDLAVELHDGMAFSILRSPDVVVPRDQPRGNHRWAGVLLAAGPGIRSGVQVADMSICDVAPLVLDALRLPVPDDLDGRLPVEMLSSARRDGPPGPQATVSTPAARTVRTGPAPVRRPAFAPSAEPVYDSESEAVILARLRALGYVD